MSLTQTICQNAIAKLSCVTKNVLNIVYFLPNVSFPCHLSCSSNSSVTFLPFLMTAFGIIFTTASTYKQKYSVNIGQNPVQVTLRPVQRDATLLDGTCCVLLHTLLHVVACCLKPVKLLSTCKRTQQLPTMLRPFAQGFKGQYTLGDKLQQQVAATDHSVCSGSATSCSNMLRRHTAATNRFVCTGEIL